MVGKGLGRNFGWSLFGDINLTVFGDDGSDPPPIEVFVLYFLPN